MELNYKIINENKNIRRENWNNFVDKKKSVLKDKENDLCVLFVCCNSYELIKKSLKYLDKEKNKSFDIIIIDNSTKDEETEKFHNLGKVKDNIILLKPIDNLGASGGYSIGMEYTIEKKYKHIVLFEDDIIPIDKDIVSTIIEKSKDEKNIIFNECANAGNSFWYFHIACYPIEFIKKSGVVDPRFFLKSDDLERLERVENIIKKDGYKKISIGKRHFHPNFKKDGWKIWVTYLAIRNYLFTLKKYFKLGKFNYFSTLFLYIWYGISKIFLEGDFKLLITIIRAVFDFLFGNIGFQYNKYVLNKLFKLQLSKPKNLEEKIISIDELNKTTNNMFNIYGKVCGDYNSFGNIKYSRNIKDGIKNGVVTAGIYSNIYPIFMLFQDIIFINEFDFEKNLVNVSVYKNNIKFRILKIAFSLLLSILIFIPILIIIILKVFYGGKGVKKIG